MVPLCQPLEGWHVDREYEQGSLWWSRGNSNLVLPVPERERVVLVIAEATYFNTNRDWHRS